MDFLLSFFENLTSAPRQLDKMSLPPRIFDWMAILQVLGKVWTLRQVHYIDGVESLYSCTGTAHDGVLTKLAAWGLTACDRVLLLDIDIVILKDRPIRTLRS